MYLLPQPQQWNQMEGNYTIAYDRKILLDTSCSPNAYSYAKLLQEDMTAYMGYTLPVTRGTSRKTAVTLAVDTQMRTEEYGLDVNESGIFVAGGSDQGLFYGVQTLRQMIRQAGACIPCTEIFDYPRIPNRGYYHDVTRGRIPTLDYLKKLVDKISFYKLNQLQLYVEHSFLFEGFSEVWRDDTPLTAQDILELDHYCRERHVELVPSIACFGHLYKTLRTKTYGHLCELSDAGEQPFGFVDRMNHHTLNVSDPDSIALAKRLIDEYLPLFTSKHFNICSDETFDLGKGKSCMLAQEKGTQRMYLDFVKELCTYVIEKGKIPMFWGDIICEFPEAIRELPEETICLNWGYDWNCSEDSTRKLSEAGANLYNCPGVSGWDQFVNNIWASYENIRRMCSYAYKYNAIGVLNTDWGDCGHINHPDFSVTGMIYGASFSWNREIPEFAEINRQISRVEFEDSSEGIVSILAEISDGWVFCWRDAVNFMEGKAAAFDVEKLHGTQDALVKLRGITENLYHIIPELSAEKRELVKPYLVAIRGMELIQKTGVVLGAREYQTDMIFPVDARKLASDLENWFYDYKEVWRSVSRESELYRIQNVVFWYADYLRQV